MKKMYKLCFFCCQNELFHLSKALIFYLCDCSKLNATEFSAVRNEVGEAAVVIVFKLQHRFISIRSLNSTNTPPKLTPCAPPSIDYSCVQSVTVGLL